MWLSLIRGFWSLGYFSIPSCIFSRSFFSLIAANCHSFEHNKERSLNARLATCCVGCSFESNDSTDLSIHAIVSGSLMKSSYSVGSEESFTEYYEM